ncbi:N-6 DNA methylase [Glycomyces sp. A-F 0318]|uniref:N-6 DNA methylase n=1 Tax=Glycomyces amatae TaxID=2881355 RepID=UPI001E324072|nr:N-6 DNA methylase [Glycomyces amatae]MCD0447065.1 N-6 DNA methylase [Glycomyces amatae]
MSEPSPTEFVTAAEIARRAAVTRATVSNWRRRHPDFPEPAGGTTSSPGYDWEAVHVWLTENGKLPEPTAADLLRERVRSASLADPSITERLMTVLGGVAGRPGAELAQLALKSDEKLGAAVSALNEADATMSDPDVVSPQIDSGDLPLVRDLLDSIVEHGSTRTLDFLVEAESGAARAAFTMPLPIAELMVRLTFRDRRTPPGSLLNPASSSGQLVQAAAKVEVKTIHLQSDRRNLLVQSCSRIRTVKADTRIGARVAHSLKEDPDPDLRVDAVVCNLLAVDPDWNHDELVGDPRWTYGVPDRKDGALAWAQHCLAHLRPGGLAALLMPPALAWRPQARRIRAAMVTSGAVRAVIALPSFPGVYSGLQPHLWVLRRPEPDAEAGPVLFLDCAEPAESRGSGRERGRRSLDPPALRDEVLRLWDQLHADEASSPARIKRVRAIDLLADDVDFAPNRHVRPRPPATSAVDYMKLSTDLRTHLVDGANRLIELSRSLDLDVTEGDPRTWRSVRIGDLERGEAVRIVRSATAKPTPRGGEVAGEARDSKERLPLEEGDVMLPEPSRLRRFPCWVVEQEDLGREAMSWHVVLRPDPARFDSWFLAGFLGTEYVGYERARPRSSVRVDIRQLRVPIFPLDEQRRYGRMFRELYAVQKLGRSAREFTDRFVQALSRGLVDGWMTPHGPDDPRPRPDNID